MDTTQPFERLALAALITFYLGVWFVIAFWAAHIGAYQWSAVAGVMVVVHAGAIGFAALLLTGETP